MICCRVGYLGFISFIFLSVMMTLGLGNNGARAWEQWHMAWSGKARPGNGDTTTLEQWHYSLGATTLDLVLVTQCKVSVRRKCKYVTVYGSHTLFSLILKLELEHVDMDLKIKLIRSNNLGLDIKYTSFDLVKTMKP